MKKSQLYYSLVVLVSLTEAVRVHVVHWNASNPLLFNSQSTINIRGNVHSAWDYEQANIICPFYSEATRQQQQPTEQYVIYNVTQDEYQRCQLNPSATHPAAKIVALCNTPYKYKFVTLTFRSFSPTPGAFEFHPGQRYYFIAANYQATSSRPAANSWPQRCSHPPMKLVFRIQDSSHVGGNDTEAVHNTTPKEMPPMMVMASVGSSVHHMSTLLAAIIAICCRALSL